MKYEIVKKENRYGDCFSLTFPSFSFYITQFITINTMCAAGVTVSNSEREIVYPCSNSICNHYNHFRANTLEEGLMYHFSSYVLKSKADWTSCSLGKFKTACRPVIATIDKNMTFTMAL